MRKLSIITINFNNAAGLKRTIESVINQTSNEFEYILIDGGSTDGSLDVIKTYQNQLTYWVSEKDQGIYNAMNKGIQKAQGEYCQFLNSGDWLASPRVIDEVVAQLDGNSITYGNMIKVWADGKTLKNGAIEPYSLFTFYKGTLNHPSAYIKRALFNVYGLYDETLRIVADWKFYLIAIGLHNESVQYLDIDVAYFDMSGISTTQKELERTERRHVLEAVLPPSVLNDYDRYGHSIRQMSRIQRHPWANRLVWLIERLLFKVEKNRFVR